MRSLYCQQELPVLHDTLTRTSSDITCASACKFSAFPAIGDRSTTDLNFKSTTKIAMYCVCCRPEHPEDIMAECEGCGGWFHQHIPDSVFDMEEPWKCRECTNKL